ncbi:MAG TPA: hypothetical protein PLB32_08295, partial [Acidobacteriota bacterium]|nr:hypothetical protein [Acidobacteriota bacterium]
MAANFYCKNLYFYTHFVGAGDKSEAPTNQYHLRERAGLASRPIHPLTQVVLTCFLFPTLP